MYSFTIPTNEKEISNDFAQNAVLILQNPNEATLRTSKQRLILVDRDGGIHLRVFHFFKPPHNFCSSHPMSPIQDAELNLEDNPQKSQNHAHFHEPIENFEKFNETWWWR